MNLYNVVSGLKHGEWPAAVVAVVVDFGQKTRTNCGNWPCTLGWDAQ